MPGETTGRRSVVEVGLVHVTPPPALARLEGLHDRMGALAEVRAGMAARRRVAAADVAAAEAQAEVNPAAACSEALLAALWRAGRDIADLRGMDAAVSHVGWPPRGD